MRVVHRDICMEKISIKLNKKKLAASAEASKNKNVADSENTID